MKGDVEQWCFPYTPDLVDGGKSKPYLRDVRVIPINWETVLCVFVIQDTVSWHYVCYII